MRCDEFEHHWNEALDSRELPQQNPALAAHAALCPHCAELLAASDLLARAYPAREPVLPSAGWRDATVRACVVERALQVLDSADVAAETDPAALPLAVAASSASNRRWYIAAAVAAGLLVAIVIGQARQRAANNLAPQAQPEQIVNQPVVPPAPPVLNKSSDVTPAAAPESSLALASFNREQIARLGYQVSDGLRPVTMGVSNAWQTIKRPLSKSEMEPEVPPQQNDGRSSSWMIVRECYV
jgi:hypothetical protein